MKGRPKTGEGKQQKFGKSKKSKFQAVPDMFDNTFYENMVFHKN